MDRNKWRVVRSRNRWAHAWWVFAPGDELIVSAVRRTHQQAIDAIPLLAATRARERLGKTAP